MDECDPHDEVAHDGSSCVPVKRAGGQGTRSQSLWCPAGASQRSRNQMKHEPGVVGVRLALGVRVERGGGIKLLAGVFDGLAGWCVELCQRLGGGFPSGAARFLIVGLRKDARHHAGLHGALQIAVPETLMERDEPAVTFDVLMVMSGMLPRRFSTQADEP